MSLLDAGVLRRHDGIGAVEMGGVKSVTMGAQLPASQPRKEYHHAQRPATQQQGKEETQAAEATRARAGRVHQQAARQIQRAGQTAVLKPAAPAGFVIWTDRAGAAVFGFRCGACRFCGLMRRRNARRFPRLDPCDCIKAF
jgi:hypothetical protein